MSCQRISTPPRYTSSSAHQRGEPCGRIARAARLTCIFRRLPVVCMYGTCGRRLRVGGDDDGVRPAGLVALFPGVSGAGFSHIYLHICLVASSRCNVPVIVEVNGVGDTLNAGKRSPRRFKTQHPPINIRLEQWKGARSPSYQRCEASPE